jgi:hypothetical protein
MKRTVYVDDESEKMLHEMHWYFENKSVALRNAIRLLYLVFTKKVEIDWKDEKPIIW